MRVDVLLCCYKPEDSTENSCTVLHRDKIVTKSTSFFGCYKIFDGPFLGESQKASHGLDVISIVKVLANLTYSVWRYNSSILYNEMIS